MIILRVTYVALPPYQHWKLFVHGGGLLDKTSTIRHIWTKLVNIYV
jgi:hypothetical protein